MSRARQVANFDPALFAVDEISGDKVSGGTISTFASTGIDDNADANAITIDSSERVGIGLASPLEKVEIRDSNAKIRFSSGVVDSGQMGLEFNHRADSGTYPTLSKTAIVSDPDGNSWGRTSLKFVLDNEADSNDYSIANDTKMIIKPDGKVGIGTAAPESQLHLESEKPTLIFHDTKTTVESEDLGKIQFHTADGSMPGGIGAEIRAYASSGYGDRADIIFSTAHDSTSLTERMRLSSEGTFKVSTNAFVDEGIYIGVHTGDNQIRVGQTGGGSAAIAIGNRTITVYLASDERKKDVIGETSRGLADVLKWKIKDFTWKPEWDRDSTTINTGAIAQEFIKVSPELVNKHEVFYKESEKENIPEGKKVGDLKSDVWGIEWINAIPYLVKAIQELSAKIDALETKVTALENA